MPNLINLKGVFMKFTQKQFTLINKLINLVKSPLLSIKKNRKESGINIFKPSTVSVPMDLVQKLNCEGLEVMLNEASESFSPKTGEKLQTDASICIFKASEKASTLEELDIEIED